jgi:hypothetical protein
MGQIIDKIMGGDEGGGDAAVKRQAEGASNPMYALANLIGQVCTVFSMQGMCIPDRFVLDIASLELFLSPWTNHS